MEKKAKHVAKSSDISITAQETSGRPTAATPVKTTRMWAVLTLKEEFYNEN